MQQIHFRTAFLALFLAFSLLNSCSDSPADDHSTPLSIAQQRPTWNGSEGGPVELNIAASWTANYRAAHPGEIEAHFFGSEILNDLLGQSGAIGIRMYRAYDDDGDPVMVLVAADIYGNEITSMYADWAFPCPKSCDLAGGILSPTVGDGSQALNAQIGASIDAGTALGWIANYQNAHPQGIHAHFTGRAILTDLLTQEDAVGIRIYYGITASEEEKVVLVASKQNGHNIENGIVADWTAPCPPYCK
ncbi:MAG: hypothetical protein AAF570_27475 [Bacteroidota bacterium]